MKDTIKDIPIHDFMEAINKNIREGNIEWVTDTLKRFKVEDEKAILKMKKD
jgi:hypothetical protein